jgi:hypothetical protein
VRSVMLFAGLFHLAVVVIALDVVVALAVGGRLASAVTSMHAC